MESASTKRPPMLCADRRPAVELDAVRVKVLKEKAAGQAAKAGDIGT